MTAHAVLVDDRRDVACESGGAVGGLRGVLPAGRAGPCDDNGRPHEGRRESEGPAPGHGCLG